ncbi:hypothetical protein ABT273_36195, partial [Streptomyces humidus]|uniref:hypothetical protein n=1 Tax=Streptomyces humidus TaxID=52259 RepID=UPI003318A336
GSGTPVSSQCRARSKGYVGYGTVRTARPSHRTAHEAHGDAESAHTARARAEELYATIGVETGSRVPPRPLPGHRHRELPQDAESRLTLYLTEHFDG